MKSCSPALILLPNLALAAEEIRLPPEVARLNAMSGAPCAGGHPRRPFRPACRTSAEALAHLVRAARITDALFMRQVWAGNESMLLQADGGHDAARPGAPQTIS